MITPGFTVTIAADSSVCTERWLCSSSSFIAKANTIPSAGTRNCNAIAPFTWLEPAQPNAEQLPKEVPCQVTR